VVIGAVVTMSLFCNRKAKLFWLGFLFSCAPTRRRAIDFCFWKNVCFTRRSAHDLP